MTTLIRKGIVYIAEDGDKERLPRSPRFHGHWESVEPPALLESGPGWANVELAIVWGRERADVVLVRLGVPGTYYSAGDRQPQQGEPLPEWPPASHLA